MILNELLPWLFRRTPQGVRWGLERTEALLAGVGEPHRRFRSLHIGGTNGKGSVAALCDSVLRRTNGAGRVGLYTSPHLVSFTERMRVDGVPLDEEILLRAAERMRPEIERTGATFFEATTALAFLCFAEAGVETAVVEVGLGGRLDATNVIVPVATAITNVSREHTEMLGESLEAIAAEKAGILKRGVPAVTGVRQPAALDVVRRRAAEVDVPLRVVDEEAEIVGAVRDPDGMIVSVRSTIWGERQLRLGLRGRYQARNALVAMELLALLPPEIRPDAEALEDGFRVARWPGRLQVERVGDTTWLLDVAHNPAGMEALAEELVDIDLPRPWILVAGVLADKEWPSMLPPLLGRVDGAVFTVPPTAPEGRRWSPDVAARVLTDGTRSIRSIPDFEAALRRAQTLAPHGTVIVTGSVHTVGDAMAVLGIAPA